MLLSAEIDENLSPNCHSVCTSTPTSADTTSSPRLSFKATVGHAASPLASTSLVGEVLVSSGCDLDAGRSDCTIRFPRDSQPLSDYSAETAQSSFTTARAHSDCSDTSLIEQESSQKLQDPEFATPSESFDTEGDQRNHPQSNEQLCQLSSVFLSQIQPQEQREADQSIMGDVSMMSVDGNMSVDVRDECAPAGGVPVSAENG